jgi:hypothetical protein
MITKEEIEKIRKRMLDKKGGGFRRDPTKFSVEKAKLPKSGAIVTYKLRLLPPVNKGDKVLDGDKLVVAESDVDWAVEHGSHYINNRFYECPRIGDGGTCPVCDIGFGLFKKVSDKDKRSDIAKAYLSKGAWAVNAYFLNVQTNPEEIRGKVMWLDLNKSLYDICDQCIMADDAGNNEDDPKAFGAFFDEDEGFVLQMEVRLDNQFASYKTSKFLPRTAGPLVKTAEGTADAARIKEILSRRQILPRRFEKVNLDELTKIAATIGDDDDGAAEVEETAASVVRPGSKGRPLPAVVEEEEEAPAAPAPKAKSKPVPVQEEEEPVAAAPTSEEEEPVVAKPKPLAAKKPAKPAEPVEEAPAAAEENDPELASLLDTLSKNKKK